MANVFISHSSADKPRFVQALVTALQERRHNVWYDTDSIGLTDSIPLKISEGVETSEYAIVVVSPTFLASKWCLRELGSLVMGSITAGKKLIVIRLDGADVPGLLVDIRRLEPNVADPASVASCIEEVVSYLDRAVRVPSDRRMQSSQSPAELVDVVLDANRAGRFGANLLPREAGSDGTRPENEGLILIKPGGTFYEPCLTEIFGRAAGRCRIQQVRLFNGPLIAKRHLFEQQYATPVRLATGEIPLDGEDLDRIREIYDSPEFERIHGVPYSDDLVVPALRLTDDYGLPPDELSGLWEQGRTNGRFHTRRPDGLNKIAYQKSVFPIALPRIGLRIVLNGFIPGYRRLFAAPEARVVAIHASTAEPWQVVRDELVGGNSDPAACRLGSIRRDSVEGKLPLDPADSLVNGQRNVCHSSATLFDGMRELCLWFEYDPRETLVGQICELRGIDPGKLVEYAHDDLPHFSWDGRDANVTALFFEVRMRVAKGNLRSDVGFRERVAQFARAVDDKSDLGDRIGRNPALAAFIEDGLRLTAGDEELYQHAVAKMFRDSETKTVFLEAAQRIEALTNDGRHRGWPEIVAAAYRIAAGDLLFLKCPAYDRIANRHLFRATVIGELAEQALACGRRTWENFIRDLRGSFAVSNGTRDAPSIREHPAWAEFVESCSPIETNSEFVAVILAGGRSTRMASTIPKPVLPLRDTLLLARIDDTVRSATRGEVDVFAAVGFRADLIEKAMGDRMRYLAYDKTLGLGFRVATALEMLAEHDGPVLVMYADMPEVSITTIERLLDAVAAPRTFGFAESASNLSGHVIRANGRIERIVQSRLERPPSEEHMRDVGVYAFHNTPEFRAMLQTVRNDNVRGEYMFADVVRAAIENGWDVASVVERPELATGINTPAELLSVACRLGSVRGGASVDLAPTLSMLASNYGIEVDGFESFRALKSAIEAHVGPIHFFQRWDALWS